MAGSPVHDNHFGLSFERFHKQIWNHIRIFSGYVDPWKLIYHRRLLRIALSDDPLLDIEERGNDNKGCFSPRKLISLVMSAEDLWAFIGLFRLVVKGSDGNSNLPTNSPRITLANSSMLNVIAMSISNHPKSCWKPYINVIIVFRRCLGFPAK